MAWDTEDFVIFGAMLLAAGLTWTLARRGARSMPYRFAVVARGL